MSNNYVVYIHISPSNKRYIGITSMKPKKRWNNGKGYYKNIYFTNAIKKYGWNNFQHIIIAKGLTEDEAKWLEIELIREWDSTNRKKGYNISFGGDIVSDETREKMSKSHIGENNSMYGVHRYGEDNPFYGKTHTKETKQEQSERVSGENNPMYGVHRYGKDSPNAKSVICLTTKRIFFTAKEGADFYSCNSSALLKCCRKEKNRKSCGKYQGKKLVWRYLVYKHDIVLKGSDISKLHIKRKVA